MIFYLTNVFLDITFGATYWLICKTVSGGYYLIWGYNKDNEPKYIKDVEIQDSIDDLLEKNKTQAEQIIELKMHITELKELIQNDYIKIQKKES